MAKTKLTDLNDHLFEVLERLRNEDLSESEIEKESKKAKIVVSISKEILNTNKLRLSAIDMAYNKLQNNIPETFD